MDCVCHWRRSRVSYNACRRSIIIPQSPPSLSLIAILLQFLHDRVFANRIWIRCWNHASGFRRNFIWIAHRNGAGNETVSVERVRERENVWSGVFLATRYSWGNKWTLPSLTLVHIRRLMRLGDNAFRRSEDMQRDTEGTFEVYHHHSAHTFFSLNVWCDMWFNDFASLLSSQKWFKLDLYTGMLGFALLYNLESLFLLISASSRSSESYSLLQWETLSPQAAES